MVQPTGNMPLVDATNKGKSFSEIKPTPNPKSIASGLLDPYPWDEDLAIESVRKSKGFAIAISDEEIMDAVKLLAKYEGIFAEPSGAVGIAALKKLVKMGEISQSDLIVVLITGSGLKESEKIISVFSEPPLIKPDLDELLQYLRGYMI